MATLPARIPWAVEKMALCPDDDVLEIGCGRGHAVALIAERLTSGTITAIDRSPKAIEAATARHRALVAAGTVTFHAVALAEAVGMRRFDRILAINVNAFWLRPETALPAVRALLAPGGTLHLVHQPPDERRTRAFAAAMPRHLADHGFRVDDVLIEPMTPVAAACIVARLKEHA